MRFDSQEQKDFVLNAVNNSPVQTTIGALIQNAGAVLPYLQAIKAGEVGPPPAAEDRLAPAREELPRADAAEPDAARQIKPAAAAAASAQPS